MKSLAGKTAVITGGAGGIGETGVRLFVEHGANVVIADIDAERGAQLADELGDAAAFIPTDSTDADQVKAALSYAIEKFGRLDCLWNNAGATAQTHPMLEKVSLEGFDRVLTLGLQSIFFGMKFAAPLMKTQGSGSIINTASVAGLRAGFATHLYSAAKAAIIHLTRSVAMELGESGVRVNCLCPGGVATPLLGKVCGLTTEEAEKKIDAIKAYLAHLNPLKRACVPEDVAEAALWLASDDASFINGHALVMDGGVTCGRLWSATLQDASLR